MFMASSSSSSAPDPQVMKYDVFLSFRGEDTRNTFTSHLYGALDGKKIRTFIDNELPRGDEISPYLLKTIKESKISLIIFSKNYANSRWCLQELKQILHCRKKNGQIVKPVFYHALPSDVRHQKGKFGVAFAKLEKRFEEGSADQLKAWKAALEEAANLSGFEIDLKKTEYDFVMTIVDDISNELRKVSPCYDEDLVGVVSSIKDLVGVESSIEKVKSLLQKGVPVIGIWGIGGVGKTTIAGAVAHQIWGQFEGFFFASIVREEWKNSRLSSLKKKLHEKIDLQCKKVLIIFDDVTTPEQIKELIGGVADLYFGSQIIITTRDKQVLRNCGVDDSNIYEVKGLCDNDALQLFNMHAFRPIDTPEVYEELTNIVLAYAKGLPLALKVLGRFLCGRSVNDWKSKIEKLEKFPNKDIQAVLEISYDVLDREEKEIFLDIACFFKDMPTSFVTNILDANGFSAHIRLTRLNDMCLITIVNGRITMHDLLQEMGREIARRESDDPRLRSRLWLREDICEALVVEWLRDKNIKYPF